MAADNVDVVRQSIDAFNAFMRGELSSEAYANSFHPQVERSGGPSERIPTLLSAFRVGPSFSRSPRSIGMGGST